MNEVAWTPECGIEGETVTNVLGGILVGCMQGIRRFEDLKVWQDALEVSHHIYQASLRGAFARDFALRDQMRRAAISVVSNIAEGFESRTDRLFIEFLGRAKASAGELRAQLHLAYREGYFDEATFRSLSSDVTAIGRQIGGFMKYLDQCTPTNRKPSRAKRPKPSRGP